ncbi:MAG: protein-glutamate O-methyltransferase CheR, partial [Beijerinckiaceae bacterium]|nr:protein-glutamate O-methyltransferase CheR [Beijerinckiaceae bacterium]
MLLHQRSGLSLSPEKRYLAESRLGILCRRRNIADIATLIQKLRPGNDAALEHAVIEAMTTNETLFFRDHTPFDLFRDVILPERLAANAATRSLRIWCAAVSTGQEAYSLAMILDEMGPRLSGWKIQIVGTDISGEVLERARTGLYSQFEIQRGLPIQMLLKHFSQEGDRWRISERLRA